MGFLAGKRILITGVLSKHSIAYGIAKACHREGACLAFTYQNERFLDRINKFANEFDSQLVYPCDVSDDAQIEAVDKVLAEIGAAQVRQILVWNKIDLTPAEPVVERDECGSIRRVFLSARTGEGLDLLREVLAELAQKTFPEDADRDSGTVVELPFNPDYGHSNVT